MSRQEGGFLFVKKEKVSKRSARSGRVALFGNVLVMVIAAQLVALSIILGKYLAINIGNFLRISFENLPILLAGVFLGPIVGAAVGACADIIGCFLVGYALNPIITLGAVAVGAVSGVVGRYLIPINKEGVVASALSAFVSSYSAHVIGSVIIKTFGMMVYYGMTLESLWVRAPLYACIAATDGAVLWLISRSRVIRRQLDLVQKRQKAKQEREKDRIKKESGNDVR